MKTSYPHGAVSEGQQILDLYDDITGHIETERVLRADVAHKDILLQEISHRVLNGFHLISGMLQLQARRATNDDTKQQLAVAAQRVSSMALVHRRLYESAKDIAHVNAKVYLTGLCQELREGFFLGDGKRTLLLDSIADLDFPTEKMAVIGLIVAELVTNACKYAYSVEEEGAIAVSLTRHDTGYQLSIGDFGRGLPDGFDVERSKGLGMSIVKAQIAELSGLMEINRLPPGVRFIIHIPKTLTDRAHGPWKSDAKTD